MDIGPHMLLDGDHRYVRRKSAVGDIAPRVYLQCPQRLTGALLLLPSGLRRRAVHVKALTRAPMLQPASAPLCVVLHR